jgi:class 3 adenylate cyclase
MSVSRGPVDMGDCRFVGPVPTGTVTFLFTDIENSTGWWDQHPVEMRQALEDHDRILHEVVVAHDGFVFSHGGGGVAVAFQRATDAVGAALEAQGVLLGEPWPSGLELRVRMGLHTGEADERDGDYFGPPLNRAARLMSAALGGQILASATTAEMLWSVMGIELVDLGTLELRGVSDRIHAFGGVGEGVPWLERARSQTLTCSSHKARTWTVTESSPTPSNVWHTRRRRRSNPPDIARIAAFRSAHAST